MIAAEYAVPSVPPANVVAGNTIVGGAMTSVYARVPANGPGNGLLSLALTVKLKVPPAVGVPLSTPPEERVSPAGSAPAVTVKVYGDAPPLAVIVWL